MNITDKFDYFGPATFYGADFNLCCTRRASEVGTRNYTIVNPREGKMNMDASVFVYS